MSIAVRPETDFRANDARAERERERDREEIVRLMHREFSSSFFEISIDLDLGHGEVVESLESLRAEM